LHQSFHQASWAQDQATAYSQDKKQQRLTMLASVALRAARSGSQAPVGVALATLDRLSAGYATAATVSAPPEPSASGAVDLAALRERLASCTAPQDHA
jgi:hypothetical protein